MCSFSFNHFTEYSSPCRNHFDVVVACEDENDEDLDVPIISIKFR